MSPPRKLFVRTGQRFGRGVVVDPEIRVSICARHPSGYRGARLRCDCGAAYESQLSKLIGGTTQSCGCFGRESSHERLTSPEHREAKRLAWTVHGLHRHALHPTWVAMVSRCGNSDDPAWESYGGRGIRVCEDWQVIELFIGWIEANLGLRPEGCTLDRIDNDGNYEPGNVRWATKSAQRRNSRNVKLAPDDVAWVKANRGVMTERAMAAVLSVSPSHIHNILAGKVWADITGSADLRAEDTLAQEAKAAV